MNWLVESGRDLQYGLRALLRTPAFTLLTVMTLAIGIGSSTAIYSVVDSALVAPLPYDGGERLVRLRAVITGPDGQPRRIPVNLTAEELRTLGERTRAFDHLATALPWLMNWRGQEPQWQGARISASAFPMLGVAPLLGRVFGPQDEQPGANSLILSEQAWERYFGRDSGVLGRSLTLESALGPPQPAVYTVVGVMPKSFEYPGRRVQFWMPFARPPATVPAPRLPTVGRLVDGVSPEQAAAEMTPVLRELAGAAQPGNQRGPIIQAYEVVSEHAERARLARVPLLAVSGAVAVLFLIACVNAAGLLLMRVAGRQREMAIRAAIGAGRRRLVRLVAIEGGVLALAASGLGGVIAYSGVRLLQWLTSVPYRFDVDIDGRNTFPGIETLDLNTSVLWFMMLLTMIAALLVTIPAALASLRAAPAPTLRTGSGVTESHITVGRRFALGNVLVVLEVAMAMMLLVGGGLLIGSFTRLMRIDPGYRSSGVLTFQVALPTDRYPAVRARDFAETLTWRLETLGGVVTAAYANQLPLVGLRDTAGGLWRTPDPMRRGGPPDAADARIVSHRYLETLGIPVLAGRGLTAADNEGGERVLLVNETLARRDFGGSSAIGQSVYMGNDPQPWRIAGIVADVRQFWLNQPAEPQFFFDARQWSQRGPLFPVGAYYALRLTGEPGSIRAAVEASVRQVEPQAVVFNVAPMDDLVTATVGRPRLYAVLLGAFAALGLTLAVLGVYGVVASNVARRTREIGVRMALGAGRTHVLATVLGTATLLTTVGIGLGVTGAAVTTRFLETMLFGVTPLDASTFVTMAGLFVVVAVAASTVPARRATRIDPLVALRQD